MCLVASVEIQWWAGVAALCFFCAELRRLWQALVVKFSLLLEAVGNVCPFLAALQVLRDGKAKDTFPDVDEEASPELCCSLGSPCKQSPLALLLVVVVVGGGGGGSTAADAVCNLDATYLPMIDAERYNVCP